MFVGRRRSFYTAQQTISKFTSVEGFTHTHHRRINKNILLNRGRNKKIAPMVGSDSLHQVESVSLCDRTLLGGGAFVRPDFVQRK